MQAANAERPARIVAVYKRSFLFGSSVRASHAKKLRPGAQPQCPAAFCDNLAYDQVSGRMRMAGRMYIKQLSSISLPMTTVNMHCWFMSNAWSTSSSDFGE
jgi:hypothetical protein